MSMTEGTLDVSRTSGIATLTFYHPQSNSFPGSLLLQLASEITQAGQDKKIKVIILQSRGEKTFCAGASFDELASIQNMEEGKVFFSGFAAVINAMRKAPKFILARIQGKAVGGGVGLAAAADYTLAHNSASVKLSELAVGIGPFVVGPAIERKIGNGAFTELAIQAAEWKSAAWALEKGLYARVYTSLEDLDRGVQSLADTLANSNPEAMSLLKKIFWEGTEDWDTLLIRRAEMSGQLVLSEFCKNAISRFKAGVRN